jgi:dipeptidyl aminopeptidase/acylaminoacyl peptidase
MLFRTRLLQLAFVSLLLHAPAALAQQPAGWSPEQMMRVKRVGSVQVSPDASRVAYVVGEAMMEGEKSEWISQIHIANADGTGAFQLTRGEKSSTSPQWSPDGAWLGFISSREGTANVYRIRPDGGEAEKLTDAKGGVSQFRWSPDGKSLALLITDARTEEEEKADKEKRDARVVDENFKLSRLYVQPVEAGAEGKREPRKLTEGEVHTTGFMWSPDGRSIVISHARTPKVFEQQDISIVDVASGRITAVARTAADEANAMYSRDGRSIAFVVSDDPPTWGFIGHVNVVPAAGGTPRRLAATFDEQPTLIGWSADARQIYFTETRGTLNRVAALPVAGGPPVEISAPDVSIDGPALNESSTTLGFTRQSPDQPAEAWVSPITGFNPKQVSRVQTVLEGAAPLGRTEVLRWKSSDGLDIEGLLTYPARYTTGTRVPLLVIVHGGPTGVFTQSFIGSPGAYPIAAFASQGYAVLRVNPRGSSGYGQKFRYANYADWGGGDYRDIMTGVDHVIRMGVADTDRLGIMGWSYGGFMTSWVITQTKRFRAASVGAGVTNLMSFTGTADIPGFIPDYFGGEYWDVFDRWRKHSAMFNIKGVSTPTLIQHGEEDRRVPIGQGYELYNALVRQNVPAKMVVYPRQPHGIQEPKLLLDAMQRNFEWFDRWILRGGRTTNQ